MSKRKSATAPFLKKATEDHCFSSSDDWNLRSLGSNHSPSSIQKRAKYLAIYLLFLLPSKTTLHSLYRQCHHHHHLSSLPSSIFSLSPIPISSRLLFCPEAAGHPSVCTAPLPNHHRSTTTLAPKKSASTSISTTKVYDP
ncbi:hypothetical protein ACH5RR_018168 [Cinchona calisaya]|uniref:Uncharacterized protein n=1 Tax=Cinchona calisaya TaxID=153742 RepID=A0ABD2ZKN1_9GENT